MKTESQLLGNPIRNFNELVFEHRHKAYGAYIIRRSYNSTIGKSLLITLLLVGLLAVGSGVFSKNTVAVADNSDKLKDSDTLISTLVNLRKEEMIYVEPVKKVEKAVPLSDNKNYKAVDTHVETMPEPTETTVTHAGGDEHGKPVDSVGTTNTFVVAKPPVENNTIVNVADEMPEFIGDLSRFLRDNLRYPRMAAESTTQGTVYLSFVVEKDGRVDDIKTLRPVGDGCTEEATRVVGGGKVLRSSNIVYTLAPLSFGEGLGVRSCNEQDFF